MNYQDGYSKKALEALAQGKYKSLRSSGLANYRYTEGKKKRDNIAVAKQNKKQNPTPRNTNAMANDPRFSLPSVSLPVPTLPMVSAMQNDPRYQAYDGDQVLNQLIGSVQSPVKESPSLPDMLPKAPKESGGKRSKARPATRYKNEPATQKKEIPQRDTTYDKDFAEYWNARFANHDIRDYDPVTDQDIPHWQNVKKNIMQKHGWTEEEFEKNFKPYNAEQWTKMDEEEVQGNISAADKSPFLGALLNTMYLPQSMVEGTAGVISKLTGYENPDFAGSDPLVATRSREGMRTTATKDMGGVGSTLYNIGLGQLDRAVASQIPILGTAALGAETAGRTLLNAENRGVDDKKAALQALGSGALSAFMNRWGFNKMTEGGSSPIGNIIGGSIAEGSEEGVEELGNIGIDTALNGDKSELATLHDYYVSQGMSSKQAWLQVAKDKGIDLATSIGTGALFGGLFSTANEIPELKTRLSNVIVDKAKNKKVEANDAARLARAEIEAEAQANANRVPDVVEQARAQAEIERLNEQLPETPEAQRSFSDMSPEEQAALQAELDNEYNFDANEVAANDTGIESNPTITERVEMPTKKDGTVLNYSDADSINSSIEANGQRMGEIETEIADLDKQLKDIPDLKKNKKEIYKLNKQKYALEQEQKIAQKREKVLNKLASGKEVNVKDVIEVEYPDIHRSIYAGQGGFLNDVALLQKFAGDDDAAKAQAQKVRDAMYKYINGGTEDDLIAFMYEVGNLDKMAQETNADYVTKNGKTYTYGEMLAGDKGYIEERFIPRREDFMAANQVARSLAGETVANNTGIDTTPRVTEAAGEGAPITVYRGYNNSDNPLESNLTRTRSVYDVIGRENPAKFENLPLSYFTESEDVANRYANQNADYLKIMEEDARREYRDLQMQGKKPNVSIDEFARQRALEKYKTLTGNDYQSNGMVESRQINPQNALDLSELGETPTIDEIYKYLSSKTGINENELDDILSLMDLSEEGDEYANVSAFRLLRNEGKGRVGSRFVDFLRNNGYDSVRYAEDGTNHWALLNNEAPESVVASSNPTVPEVTNDTGIDNRVLTAEQTPVETNQVPAVVNQDITNVPPTDVGTTADGNGRHTKTSETYINTGRYGGGWTEEEYNQKTDPSQFQYEDIGEQESIEKGFGMIRDEGFDEFRERVMEKERLSGAEIDGLMAEWRIINDNARRLEAAGEDASDIWKEGVRVFRKIQEQSTSNAQALQALAKWSRNTPEGMLAEAENIVNGKKKVNAPDKSGVQQEFEKFAKTNKKFKFSDDFVSDFLNKAQELEGLDNESREAKEIMAELGKMINRQLPAKFTEKLTSYLMDSMLGNFRTLITRNAGGNIGLNAVEQIAQRPLAALIDMGVAKKTGRRTQAGLSGKGLAEYVSGFAKGLKEEATDFKKDIHTARSGENTLANAVSQNRHVFKEKGVMDRLDKLVKHGLSVGDRPFYEAVYKQTLGDYQRLRDSGKMGETIQGLSDEDFDMYSKIAAKTNALSAVYQQDSTLSNALLKFKNAVGDLSKGIVGVDILSQFSMPFVKTPANVIERSIDYSPLGLVRNAIRTGKELKSEGGLDQNRFANETARNILGTGLMAGSAALAAKGGMSGGYSEDRDEKQAQKESGMQEYALNLGDGRQMDIGWIPVVGGNAVAAAAAVDAYNKGEGNFLGNLARGAEAGGQALFDQSMFQGLQRLFGTGESYDSDSSIFGNMANVVKSGVGQAVPSIIRQINQVADPYQRDVGNSNEGVSFGMFDNYDLNTLANNVPFLRQMGLAPKVNTSGELVRENQGRNIGSKILEDMILPGRVSKVDVSPLNQEAERLQEATTSSDAYMPKASRKYVDTAEHTLTNQEWTDYQQNYYGSMTEIGNRLMESDAYKSAKPDEQVKMLKSGYDAIRYALQSEYSGKEVSGAAKEYKDAGGGEAGIQAAFNYITKNAISNQVAEQTGYSSNSNAAKEIADNIMSGNTEAANQAIQEAQQNIKPYVEPAEALGINAQDYSYIKGYAGNTWSKVEPELPTLKGLGVTNYSQYAHAVKYADSNNQSIDAQWFANTTKALDTDNSGGVSQDELIAEFNNKNMSKDEVMRLWGMLALGKDGAETTQEPYIITKGKNKGKWGRH